AWCYGEPGIAAALVAAARAAGEPAWEAMGIALARRAAARALDEAQIADAGLCHGAAGVAHILHRLHRATGDAELGDAACRWFSHALDMRDPVAGFTACVHDEGGV